MGDYFLTKVGGRVVLARRVKDYCGGRVVRLDYLDSHVETYRNSCWSLREIVGANPDPLNSQILGSVERVYNARTLSRGGADYEFNHVEQQLNNVRAYLRNGSLCPQAADEVDHALKNFGFYRQDPIVHSQIAVPFLHHIAEALLKLNGKISE